MTRGTRANGTKNPVGPAGKKRPSESRKFCLDDDLARAAQEAQEAYSRAERYYDRIRGLDLPSVVEDALERLESARVAMEQADAEAELASWTLRLEGIPRKEYWDERAKPEHEPTDEQRQKHMDMLEEEGQLEGLTEAQVNRLRLKVNPDTWPRWLVTRCGGLTDEESESIFGDNSPWTSEDLRIMYEAAELACQKTALLAR